MRVSRLSLLVVGVLALGVTGAQTKKPSSTKQLKNQLQDIKEKKQDILKKLHVVRKDIRDVRGDVEEIDSNIDRVEARFHRSEEKLGSAKKEQVSLAQQLKEAQAEYKVKSEMARVRLKYIRMYGKITFASALVGKEGVSQLASRNFVFRKIADKDRELFESVRTLRDQIASKKVRSDQLVGEIQGLMVEQREAHAELSANREVKKDILVGLQGKAADLEKFARQLDAAENEVESIIASRAGHYSATRPGRLSNPCSARITSSFGMRYHPILHYKRMHKGIDYGASYGSTIRAAADGVVISAGRSSGFGNCIIIDHGGGLTTLYAHCSSFIIGNGARVKRGQPIARVGATGLATGPHLHFEVHIGGKAVNPRSYL